MNNSVFTLKQGRTPLLISMPHIGTAIPEDQQHRYMPQALQSEDTDWYLDRLYGELAEELGASLIKPHYSRYLIDLNRPPEDTPMYPGASNTELCPTRFFTGESLYKEGQAPDELEKQRRRQDYWLPYHRALNAELQRLKNLHGHAVLFDAHSIRSELPWLFEGRLPDLNLGTADGKSCDASITARLGDLLASQADYTQVVNGRFKGGFITRHYGQPAQGQHAVQLEMCQCCYMDETPPFAYREDLASRVQPLLKQMFQSLLAWKP
ncbi:N-formylglutamate deformylase [Pelomonas sp. SE-A7]|uniref:N-formylglutamate deformylase n=1 Tax=Pelomonas sp. SE-A7 TaxID=3054953 RepID=UPI00259CCAB9|nr:N-formylglutamate deformylase [Pelomonas sp. SE-A7]MDM4766007.1 N-formylglutamate deformylase [Pelomonas sp. SE-A7]